MKERGDRRQKSYFEDKREEVSRGVDHVEIEYY